MTADVLFEDFLFEIGCEELPTQIVTNFPEQLKPALTSKLNAYGFSFADIKSYATPRRLAFIIDSINSQLPVKTELKKGPAVSAAWDRDGKPTQALLGFAKSVGITDITPQTFATLSTDKGEWLTYNLQISGASIHEVMPVIIKELLKELFTNKLMSWGSGEFEFVRPVHWLIMLYGSKVVNAKLFDITADNMTYGHRFHAPDAIIIQNSSEYLHKLLAAKVIVDQDLRRATILKQIEKIVKKYGAVPEIPNELITEITAIVEWPHAYLGNIDEHFLQLPIEVINTTLQVNQRLITMVKDGELLPHFIAIANIESQDPTRVIRGNEQVVKARLSDAFFFFLQDKKIALESYIPKLKSVVLRANMGTLFDKYLRLQEFMQHHMQNFTISPDYARRAVELCQCDLLTNMVNEFPELQGIMGFHYARLQHEPIAVAEALQEYYLPRFSEDKLPKTQLGLLLAIADRMDNLVGSFMLGQQPNGVKDPFKLRRQGLGLARLLSVVENISFAAIFKTSWQQWINFGLKPVASEIEIFNILKNFIIDRLISHNEAQGIQKSITHAVLARQNDSFFDVHKRILAVQKFMTLPEAESLLAACKRVNNILAKQTELENLVVNPALFQTKSEHNLFNKVSDITIDKHSDYVIKLIALADFKTAIDNFFEDVMVLVPEVPLRRNRLALLKLLQSNLCQVADLSLI